MLSIPNLGLTELPESFPFETVKYLDCSGNKLTALSLPTAITVYCFNNQLTSLSLPAATMVYCNNNRLTSLSLPSAVMVYCFDNQLTSLSLPAAITVFCSNNQLQSLSLPVASTVGCNNNQLSSVPYMPQVRRLTMHNNPLEYLLAGMLTKRLIPLIKKDRSHKFSIIAHKWKHRVKKVLRHKKAKAIDQSSVLDGVMGLANMVASYT